MKNTIKIAFFIYKAKTNKDGSCPIYIKIKNDADTVSLSTGMSIDQKLWDSNKSKVRGYNTTTIAINENLLALENKVRLIIASYVEKNKPFSVHAIKNDLIGNNKQQKSISDAFEYYLNNIKKMQGVDYSKSTYTKYRQTHDRVKEFIRHKYLRNDLYLYELNMPFMDSFTQYIKVDVGNNQTTFYKHFQRLTRVIKIAKRNAWMSNNPFDGYVVKLPKKEVKYLTIDELKAIEEKDFNNERLNNIKWFFLFSCYSGLAYTEILNLNIEHIVKENDGDFWLKMERQKTKSDYKLPLLPQAIEIMDRYNNHACRKEGKIFPIPSNVKFNAYLKEIQNICNINTTLTVHLARKTFAITILLYNNVSIPVISQMLGHASIQVTVNAYQAIIPELVTKEFKSLRDKLKK